MALFQRPFDTTDYLSLKAVIQSLLAETNRRLELLTPAQKPWPRRVLLNAVAVWLRSKAGASSDR